MRNSAQFSKAVSHYQAGNLSEAEALCRAILSSDPAHFAAMSLLGTIYLRRGQREQGIQVMGRSLGINPNQPTALNMRGIALNDLKRHEEALASYDKAIVLNPRYVQAYNNRGIALDDLNRYDGALASYDKAIALNPNQPEIHNNRGNTLSALKRYDEALASYNRALALNPGYAEAHNNRGAALNNLKRYDEALASCDRALALNPGSAEAHNNRGNVLNNLARHEAALASYDNAIALSPVYAEAHYNRGNAFSDLKRFDEALAAYDRAITLAPRHVQAYNNRGVVLDNLNHPDEALASYDKAIALNPHQGEFHNNRGNVLNNLKRYDEALASYDKAIALNPDDADPHLNKGYLKLLLGEYEEGWGLCEWRWKHPDPKKSPRRFPKPLWVGQDTLADKTILLHTEQGLGDSIQFCRYAPMVEALGAKVVLQAQQPLVTLFSTIKDSIRVIPAGDPLLEFDCHCPLMSLPLAFKTTVNTIPAQIPYLRIDPEKQNGWQARMGRKTNLRIGLVWSGRTEHQNDHNRSIRPHVLAPILALDLEFHCLQKEIRSTDRAFLTEHPQVKLHEEHLNDFSETAALVSCMDLVICVDTSLAHLAGALGRPVWILLPFAPDYRWMTNREDSPWYPTARLFRQRQLGDWANVITKVVAELQTICPPSAVKISVSGAVE